MKKVALKVEMDEETYKQIKGDSVYDNNNKVIISNSSSAYYALNAIINATTLTECEDAVSRQVVKEQMLKYGFRAPDMTVTEFVEDLPPVIPKREENTVSEEVYTEEYTRRKALEYENYVLKAKKIIEKPCQNLKPSGSAVIVKNG